MECSDKNVEMTKMMAKIEQLNVENKNLTRLLHVHSMQLEGHKPRSGGKFFKQDVISTPKTRDNLKQATEEKKSDQEYPLYDDEAGEWKEYNDEDANDLYYEKKERKS